MAEEFSEYTPAPDPTQADTELKTMAQQLLDELHNLAFSDVGEMYDEANCLLDIKAMPPAIRRAISSIDTEEIYIGSGHARELIGHTKKVKLYDKKGSIEMWMKKLGMFIDRIEQKQTVRTMNVDLSGKTPEELIRILNGSD